MTSQNTTETLPETEENTGGQRSPLTSIPRFVGLLITHMLKLVWVTLQRGYGWAEGWLLDSRKALYGLAVTRILMGLTALGLLLSNYRTRLYSFGSGSVWNGEAAEPKSDFPSIWLFSIFHRAITNDLVYSLLYIILILLAVLIIVGWRTRVTMPVFFVMWVSFIEANDMLGDQGDNMMRIALLIMLFADPAARWSLDAKRRKASLSALELQTTGVPGARTQIGNLFHNLALVALTVQVSFVYMSGALYKAGGSPWSGGYAVYNPLQTDRFGTWPILSDLVTGWGPMVVIAAWGSIILQMGFAFMLLSRPTRVIALVGILSFHVGIAVLMGLPWFSLTMIAIDSIFIRDRTWSAMERRTKSLLREARTPAGEHR